MSNRKCCVLFCQNSGKNVIGKVPKISFHLFPPLKDKERLAQWTENVKSHRPNFSLTADNRKYTVICSAHFAPDCFEKEIEEKLGLDVPSAVKARLRKDAVPTIFNRPPGPGASTRSSTSGLNVPLPQWPSIPRLGPGEVAILPLDVVPPESMIQGRPDAPMPITPSKTPSSSRPTTPSKIPIPRKRFQSMSITPTSDAKRLRLEYRVEAPMFASPGRTFADHRYMELTPGKSAPATAPESAPQTAPEPAGIARSPVQFRTDSSSSSSELLATALTVESDPDFKLLSDTDSLPEEDTSSSKDIDTDLVKMRKFMVFQSELDRLMTKCSVCHNAIEPGQTKRRVTGTMVTYYMECLQGHKTSWRSQPVGKNGRALGNILVPGAILYTGNVFQKMKTFAEALGLCFIKKTSFYECERNELLPVVQEAYKEKQERLLSETKATFPDGVTLSGDCRVDSPGHCGKFGSYSFMINSDHSTMADKILDTQLVDTAEPEVKNSNHLEPLGMKRGIGALEKAGVKVNVLATDRHITCASILRKEYSHITHQFDIWHVAKSVIKKLSVASKTKKYQVLGPWLHHISNHLWWCAATCGGDAALLKEKWTSLLYHITDKHRWTGGVVFKRCEHGKLKKTERKEVEWLKPESDAYKLLRTHVLNNYFLKCLPQLTLFCHTGELEIFHSMLLKYCPKRLSFSHAGMKGRIMLAVMDWNAQDHRPHEGELSQDEAGDVQFSKKKGGFVLRRRGGQQHNDIAQGLLARLMDCHLNSIALPPMELPQLLPRTSRLEKPTVAEKKAEQSTRFRAARMHDK